MDAVVDALFTNFHDVYPGVGPAHAAGSLRRFDQVLKVDGMEVNERNIMAAITGTDTPDTTVRLLVRRASESGLGAPEVEAVLKRVAYASLGASLRIYDTLERLRKNADFVSKFEHGHILPGEESSWVLVEMLKLELDAHQKFRHDVSRRQEKALQDSANTLMRHMLSTKEVLAQLTQEYQDMLQFTHHARSALLDRDREEAQMEEALEKLVEQVQSNKVELDELRDVNLASSISFRELKAEIQRQAEELATHHEFKAASNRAAQELAHEADMQRERVAELEGQLRRVQADAAAFRQQISASSGQLLDREQEIIQAREHHMAQIQQLQERVEREIMHAKAKESERVPYTLVQTTHRLADLIRRDVAAMRGEVHDLIQYMAPRAQESQQRHKWRLATESSVGTMMLLLADAFALGQSLQLDLAHHADPNAEHENVMLRGRVAALEAELSAAQRQLHEVEVLLQEEEHGGKVMADLEQERTGLQAHVEKQDQEMAELEKQLHDCRETLQLRDQSLMERHVQLERLAKRVEEAFQTVEKQGQSAEATKQMNRDLQSSLDIKCGELDSAYSAYNRAMLRNQTEQAKTEQAAKKAQLIVENIAELREDFLLVQELLLSHEIGMAMASRQPDFGYARGHRLFPSEDDSRHDELVRLKAKEMEYLGTIASLEAQAAKMIKLEEDLKRAEAELRANQSGHPAAVNPVLPILEPSGYGVRGGISGSSSREDGVRGRGGEGAEGEENAGTEAECSGQREERNGKEGWMSEIDRQLGSYVNSALQKLDWPLQREVDVLHRVLGVVCTTGVSAETQKNLESVLEHIQMQSMADLEMVSRAWQRARLRMRERMSNLQQSIARLQDSLESQQHTLASTQLFLQDRCNATLLYVSLERARALPLVENQEGCIYVQVEGQSEGMSMMTKIVVGPEPQIKETFVLPLDNPRQEVVFALYARESHGHSLVASLLVPLDQLFSGHTLRAWIQLVDSEGQILFSPHSGEAAAIQLEARLRGTSTFMDAV